MSMPDDIVEPELERCTRGVGVKLENTILYSLGFARVGKYTIAKELQRLTGAKLVDNHYILSRLVRVRLLCDGEELAQPKE
jgi:hypothetical protein